MPNARRFFAQVAETMKPGATLLLAEPSGHVKVKKEAFEAELQPAAAAGLERMDRPAILRSQTALLNKAPELEAFQKSLRARHESARLPNRARKEIMR
jgi:hypothetical protein